MLFSPLEQFEFGALNFIFLSFDNLKFLDFSFTNLSYSIFIVLGVFFFFNNLVFLSNDNKILSNPMKFIFEKIYLFIFNTLKDNLKWNDILYFSLISCIFLFIFFSNVIGVFPYTYTITGHIIVTFSLAFCVFLGLNILGFRIHGSFIFSLLLPEGVPFVISSLLILIEFISYNFRVISLSVRLFANIMAGHTLLAVIFGFNHFLIAINSHSFIILFLPVIALPCLLLILALISLEFGVALIQAYVFTLLCVMYLHDAKYLH
jgi:ATP synthase subunit 6